MKTRCKDCDGNFIYEGDVLLVEEYPDKYVGGSLSFEGVVTLEKGRAMITYLDIGEEESFPVSMFPLRGRKLLTENQQKEYFRVLLLSSDSNSVPEHLWKRSIYRKV